MDSKEELAKLLAQLDSNVNSTLLPTYEKLWALLTYSTKTQQDSLLISKHCNQIQAYPKMFHFALRDAKTAFHKQNFDLCESAIKILAWALNQDRSGNIGLRAIGTEFVLDTFFASEARGITVCRTCVWALRVIPGEFPPQMCGKVVDLVHSANLSACGKTLEENAGLMKCLAERSLVGITPYISKFVAVVVQTALVPLIPLKRRQKASEALTLCLPACWQALDSISKLVSPLWDRISEYINSSIQEPVGSQARVHVATYLGHVILLFGHGLKEKDSQTRKMKINSILSAQHTLLAESCEERKLAIAGWRLMIESTFIQDRIMETLDVLRKCTKEGFNSGREPDGLVRLEFFYTWTYLAQVVFLTSNHKQVDMHALFGTLRRALSDSDLRVRTAAAEYAIQLVRCLQTTRPSSTQRDEIVEERRKHILDSKPTKFECTSTHGIVLVDLIGLFENTLKQYVELDRARNLELWKACSGMWAAAISTLPDSTPTALGKELADYVWKEISNRFVGDTQAELVVVSVCDMLLPSPLEFLDWVLRVFSKRTVPKAMAVRCIALCGGIAKLEQVTLTLDLFKLVVSNINVNSNDCNEALRWIAKIFVLETEFDQFALQCWETKFLALNTAQRCSLALLACVGELPLRNNLLACKAVWAVCNHVEFFAEVEDDGGAQQYNQVLSSVASLVSRNLARVAENQPLLLDCAVFLLDKMSEHEQKFRLVLDCLFNSSNNGGGNDALIQRTLALLLNRMKRLTVLYDHALIGGLQAQDRGIRTWVVEFWNNTLAFSEKDCSARLLHALQQAKREFPNLRGIRAPTTATTTTSVEPRRSTNSSNSSNKKPRISEKKDKQVRLGVTTYSGLDISQPLFGAAGASSRSSSEDEEMDTVAAAGEELKQNNRGDDSVEPVRAAMLFDAGDSSSEVLVHSSSATERGVTAAVAPSCDESAKLQGLTFMLRQLHSAMERDCVDTLLNTGTDDDVAAFEQASQDILLALWNAKKRKQ